MKVFGEQDYFIIEPVSVDINKLIVMSILPRCIGPVDTWSAFFEKQVSFGYNGFHFPPIQELGMSNSYYSIGDQLKLSPDLFPGEDKYKELGDFVNDFKKKGVTFFVDIVLNHTSNTSEWIKDDPDAVYTVENTPSLSATLRVDCAIHEWGERIKSGQLEGYNKNTIESQEDLAFLRESLKNLIHGLNIWEYFQLH